MIGDVLAYGPTALLWAAVAYKLPTLRRNPHDAALRAYWLTLLFLALAVTVLLPPVYVAIGRVTGIPNLARLLDNGLVLVGGWSVQAFFFRLNYAGERAERDIRRSAWLLTAALVLMCVCFALARLDEAAIEFTTRYADRPFVLEYRLLFLAYLGFSLAVVVGLSWRYAGLASRPSLSLGLRLVALGGLIGLAFCAHESLFATARRLGLPYPVGNPVLLTQVLIAGSLALVVIGSTMPAWGPRAGIPALCRWLDQYRAYRRLYPLWLALYRASPHIALVPPRPALADALTARRLGFHLYRRVVETWDGRLALRPYLDARVADYARQRCRAAGLSREDQEVAVEAVGLAAALRAKTAGLQAEHPVAPAALPGGEDFQRAAAYLGKVSWWFMHSAIVRAILTDLGAPVAPAGSQRPGAGGSGAEAAGAERTRR